MRERISLDEYTREELLVINRFLVDVLDNERAYDFAMWAKFRLLLNQVNNELDSTELDDMWALE